MDLTLVRPGAGNTREVLDVHTGNDVNADIQFDLPNRTQTIPPPPPPPPRFPPPPQPEELNDFANPTKIDDSLGMDTDNGDENPEYGDAFDDDMQFSEDYQQNQQPPPAVEPLPPFATLEDERADLLFKLTRASRNGIQTRQFGYNADIRELRSEVARAKAEQDVNASIAFQRQILMTICSGLEYANRKFSYMDLELDGWSESIMDDIGKYDNVFEKLHAKHVGRISVPPEVQLILMIGGSAMTWHLTRTMMGARTVKQREPKKRRSRTPPSSSESESDREQELRRLRKPKRQKKQRPATLRSPVEVARGQPPPPPTRTRDMRGPGFDVGGMMGLGGLAGSMLPQVPVPDLVPMLTRPPKQQRQQQIIEELSANEQSSASESEEDGTQSEDRASERLSDIPSDLEDVPSNLPSSLEEDISPEEENATKVIQFDSSTRGRGRGGRGRGRGRGTKNVIVI